MSSMYFNACFKTWTPPLDCFVNELLIFDNRPLPPAAMLPFDGAFCVNLLQLQHFLSVFTASWETPQ